MNEPLKNSSALASILRCLCLSPGERERLLSQTEVPSEVAAVYLKAKPASGAKDEIANVVEEINEVGECVRILPDLETLSTETSSVSDFFLVAVVPMNAAQSFQDLFERPWIERKSFDFCQDRDELSLVFENLGQPAEGQRQEAPDDLVSQARAFILSEKQDSPQEDLAEGLPLAAPKNLAVVTLPRGFRAAGVRCGIKEKGLDLGILISDHPTCCAARYTQNRFPSPSVQLSRENLAKGDVRAVVVNSGISNAGTGKRGRRDAEAMARAAAVKLELEPHQVQVASTGLIGEFLPIRKIQEGIAQAAQNLDRGRDERFIESIMTTDTEMKYAFRWFELGGKEVALGGVAKGAGMIHPNMATMLAFLTTDANVTPETLDCSLGSAVRESFNCLSVDGDTSTSDTVLLLANGAAGNEMINSNHIDFDRFTCELKDLCIDLVTQLARHAEGATHLVRVVCSGAASWEDAHDVAEKVATSPLVKTAVFGRDPNWGRLLMAVGNSRAVFQPERVRIWLGKILLFEDEVGVTFDRDKAVQILSQYEVEIRIDLGEGKEEATVYSCDLSYDYIRINAEYHT